MPATIAPNSTLSREKITLLSRAAGAGRMRLPRELRCDCVSIVWTPHPTPPRARARHLGPPRTAPAFRLPPVLGRCPYCGALLPRQAQYTGGQGGKWNLGAAYRPPDTNINLSGSYNQGRTNLQISMVPDEGAALLGPNGFTNGVGPANLGLSFNINM